MNVANLGRPAAHSRSLGLARLRSKEHLGKQCGVDQGGSPHPNSSPPHISHLSESAEGGSSEARQLRGEGGYGWDAPKPVTSYPGPQALGLPRQLPSGRQALKNRSSIWEGGPPKFLDL